MSPREGKFQGELHNSHNFLSEGTFQAMVQSETVLLNWRERLGSSAAEVAGACRIEYYREGSLHREGAPELFPGVPLVIHLTPGYAYEDKN